MRVLVAGSTGVIGRQLMPMLRAAGHEAIGVARHPVDTSTVRADALDADGMRRAVSDAQPDVIVHLLTAIPAQINPRRMASQFAATNALRTAGTRNLVAAAREVDARVIAASIAFGYDPEGEGLATEDAPLWARPPRQFAGILDAVRALEATVLADDGLVLRMGHLYGPGTAFAVDGGLTSAVRAGKLPLVGGGSAVFSFLHGYDAATAVIAALAAPGPGVLNVVDDDPAPVSRWLPELARRVGGPAPRAVPAALVRPLLGGWGIAFFTALRGADNARIRDLLDWKPRYASWQEGFAELARAGDVD